MTEKPRKRQRPIPDHWRLFFDQKGIRSAAHLSELAGIPVMTGNRLVQGDVKTSPEILRKVARALQVDDAVIYGLAGWPTSTQPWEPPIEAEAMNPRQRKAVTELIRAFVKPALDEQEPGVVVHELRAVHPEKDGLDLAAWKRDESEPSYGEYLDGLGEDPQD